jgi:putative ABC transport system ATP-binding protein
VALVAQGLKKTFEGGLVVAVEHADLELAPGERVAILGPTGCGKSTLLAMLAMLEPPDAGRLTVDGVNAQEIRSPELWRAANLGFVFQFHYLFPHLTVVENVELALAAARVGGKERQERTDFLLAELGLRPRAHTLAAKLSGGERQLVALARALANRPRLVLADEPTGSVDTATGQRLLDFLFADGGKTQASMVLVTHDPAVAARAHRVLLMRDGRLPA